MVINLAEEALTLKIVSVQRAQRTKWPTNAAWDANGCYARQTILCIYVSQRAES